jgi:hypothetical protein
LRDPRVRQQFLRRKCVVDIIEPLPDAVLDSSLG